MSFQRPDAVCECGHAWRWHVGLTGPCAMRQCIKKCKAFREVQPEETDEPIRPEA